MGEVRQKDPGTGRDWGTLVARVCFAMLNKKLEFESYQERTKYTLGGHILLSGPHLPKICYFLITCYAMGPLTG